MVLPFQWYVFKRTFSHDNYEYTLYIIYIYIYIPKPRASFVSINMYEG
jgi:hypothetical protein